MNLHETLTNRRSIPHGMSVAFNEQQTDAHPSRAVCRTSPMTRTRHHSLLISLAVLGLLLLVPAGASAASCDVGGMLDAAANNRQISPHTMVCYQQALAAVPGDSNGYLPELRANLLSAMTRDGARASQNPDASLSRELQAGGNDQAAAAVVRGPVTNLLEGLGPAHVDQVPLPVVALGGVASLLLLAGLGTSLARVRARRLAR
jgi:hypothetical protein